MTKVVHCRDLGFDCDGVVKAATEQEALQQVTAHARTVHQLDTIPYEVIQKVHEVMRDE
jgi:predicted small metal-binding protein